MRKFKNVGNSARDLEGYGSVEVGHTVEVDPDTASGLDGQDDWEHIPDKKRSAVAKKAAATKAEESSE